MRSFHSLSALSVISFAALVSGAHAALVFSANFDDGTSGVVDDLTDLGTPAVGSFAFENTGTSTYGDISNASSGNKAFTSGNDANTRITINGATNNVPFEASPGTNFLGTDADNRLYANFAASSITGGVGATVQFDVGSYGTQNLGVFKALVVRGLSSTGDEVFETWISFGSSTATRRIYAREAGDTTYTRFSNSDGAPAGSLVYSSIAGWNSTDPTSAPGNLNTVTIGIQDGLVTYGSESGTAGSTLVFGQNSAATDIAQLEFTSVNYNQGGNSGYWLDNVTVETIPEPSAALLGGLGALALLRRRRGVAW